MSRKVYDADGDEHVILEKNEARQGRERHEMRYVVTISTIGAFLALSILYLIFN